MASVDECAENLQSDNLHEVLLEGGDGSVFELFRSSVACLPTYPGPLSAGADSFGPMPDEYEMLWSKESVPARLIANH